MWIKSLWLKFREFYCTRWYASLVILFSILMLLMLLEVKNHRFRSSDFKVYYRAAERLFNGENLYRPDIDGHYYYKYSPTAAAYFIPISFFPIVVAQVLHWIVMALLACLGFYLVLIMIRPSFRSEDPRKLNNFLLLGGLVLGVDLEFEFYLGQVNHILLVLYLVVIYLSSRGKDWLPAFIWAGTVFIKPFGLIFLPYFLLKKRFKLASLFLLFAAILAFMPIIFTGAANFAGQYQHWFHELSIEMAAKQSLLADRNFTIFSILARYTPFRLLDFTPLTTVIFQLSITGLIALLFLYLYSRGRDNPNSYVLEFAFLVALIPLLSFTNYNAFQFAELAIFLVIFNFDRLAKWWKILAVVGFILIGIDMHDVWGETIWEFINNISVVAVGAVLVLANLVNLRLKNLA